MAPSRHFAPFSTPAASDLTLNKEGFEMSSATFASQLDSETLSSNLDISEKRIGSQEHYLHPHTDSPSDLTAEEKLDNLKQQEVAAQDDEDETEYPGQFKLLIITLALCLSILCMALDNTIIATAIPKITTEFPGSIQVR